MLTEVQWQVKSWGVAGAMFPPTFYFIVTITTIHIKVFTTTIIIFILILIRWVWWVALFAYSAFILAAFAANLLIIN